MKISVEGILGSARNIKGQRLPDEEAPDRKKQGEVRTDSLDIENRIGSRLDLIQRELKELQSSLTRNQIIHDGLLRLREDIGKGGAGAAAILDEVTFEGRQVLRGFTGETVTGESVHAKLGQVENLMESDITRLTRLQIEAENILASSLAGTARAEGIIENIEGVFAKSGVEAAGRFSNLRADAVMRLIR
jgi:hypothetical protein